MSSIKQLAGQTIWYGFSNIAARLLGYLQMPIITYLLNSPAGQVSFGEYSTVYAAIPFANVLFTYGMETAYFRFSRDMDKEKLFQTSFSSLLLSTVMLSLLCWLFRQPIANFFQIDQHPEYITWVIAIIALDTLSAIPFARLRQENRPRKYAFVKVAGIILNLLLVIFFIGFCPAYIEKHPDSGLAHWYSQFTSAGMLILANLAQSALTFLLLFREWRGFKFKLNPALLKKILAYALPFVVIGLAGMVNETIDRIMLLHLYPGTEAEAKMATGIYSANYKLAIIITLFIQAFRMAAEPFFFSKSKDQDAQQTYARVMKWFVITLCVAFLGTALFLDIWKYMEGADYRSGIGVVPILLYANLFLGIYYNLSVWYKVSDKLSYGTWITVFGAVLTILVNWLFMPRYGMYAGAWATCLCYFSMMLLSYFYGQKHYPVPYNIKRILSYLGVITFLFFIEMGVYRLTDSFLWRIGSGAVLMLVFFGLIILWEGKELKSFPVLGKWL